MKRKLKLERKQLELLKDFVKLYRKYNNGEIIDLYDEHLIYILEEYDYITQYRYWRKHK